MMLEISTQRRKIEPINGCIGLYNFFNSNHLLGLGEYHLSEYQYQYVDKNGFSGDFPHFLHTKNIYIPRT